MFDIPGQIRKAINEFLLWVAKTGLTPVMDTLGSTALSTPDLTSNPHVKAFWTTSLIAANAIYALLVMLACFILASRETLQTQYGFKQIAPRLAVGAVASNVSLLLFGKIIEIANAVNSAIAGQGVDGPTAAQALTGILDQPLNGTNPNILLALLVIAAAVLGIVVVITFLLRIALLVLLFGIAPLALACHATPLTEGIAFIWWRAVGGCVGLQIGQAVVMVGAVKVFLTPSGLVVLGVPATTSGLLGVLVCVTMLWLLIKLPGLMKRFVLAPIGLRSQGRGLLGQVVQTILMIKTFGAAAGLTGAAKAGGAAASAGRPRAVTSTATTAARPVPVPRRRTGRAGTPRPVLPRPSPVGPVAFSHAPVTQTPLPTRAGTNAAPTLSHPPQPAVPAPAPSGPAPAAPFSHPNPASQPSPRPTTAAPPATFSNAASAPASPTPVTPPQAATFSHAEPSQSAPHRPPAPVTPVFSSAPTAPRQRPTAARRAAASPAPGSGGQPPASAAPARGPAPSGRRSPRPAPDPTTTTSPSRPRPTGSASPTFRPAPPSPPSPAPAAPPSPPPTRRPRGGKR
ncbi:hypothetical protein ACPCHT_31980 [Nucisporomicrobium flavum]|uniref:hypothetical protein n=1 Tax=Nucisporomicrobium flavum TaxID=2785915 RepID=UPI003C3092C1